MSIKELVSQLEGKETSSGSDKYGLVKGPINDGPLILVVDDKPTIIGDYLTALKSAAAGPSVNGDVTAQFWFFCIGRDQKGANLENLMRLLKANETLIEAIVLDGQMPGFMDGPALADYIGDKIPSLKYAPTAILSMEESWINKNRPDADRRMMRKFSDGNTLGTLRRLEDELPNFATEARDRMWSELQLEVATAVQQSAKYEEIAEIVGGFLKRHYRVEAWYLRDMLGNNLKAVCSYDPFDFGGEVPIEKSASYIRDFLEDESGKPWVARNKLTVDQTGINRRSLIGHHCIAVLLSPRNSIQQGTFTAYRGPDAKPFHWRDARELHNVALQLGSSHQNERLLERQEKTARAIGKIISAEGSKEAVQHLKQFVHDDINTFPEKRGKSKTAVRILQRGSSELVRWGNQSGGDQALGNLETENPLSISISAEISSYAQACKEKTSQWFVDPERPVPNSVQTAKDVQSWLTVPLVYGGGVLGAINLEANFRGAYNESDKRAVEALAQVTAAAIFNQRARHFMESLAQLAAWTVQPGSSGLDTPQDILDIAAGAVYNLCGYSTLLIVEPGDEEVDRNRPWRIAAGWREDGEKPIAEDDAGLQRWRDRLNNGTWERTFLYNALKREGTSSVPFTNDAKDILPDDEPGGPREGRPTLSQLVIRIGPSRQPRSLLTLLFEHPHPLPATFLSALDSFSNFITAVFDAEQAMVRGMPEHLVAERYEVMIGRQYGQLRHSVVGKLAALKGKVKWAVKEGTAPENIYTMVYDSIDEASRLLGLRRIRGHCL